MKKITEQDIYSHLALVTGKEEGWLKLAHRNPVVTPEEVIELLEHFSPAPGEFNDLICKDCGSSQLFQSGDGAIIDCLNCGKTWFS